MIKWFLRLFPQYRELEDSNRELRESKLKLEYAIVRQLDEAANVAKSIGTAEQRSREDLQKMIDYLASRSLGGTVFGTGNVTITQTQLPPVILQTRNRHLSDLKKKFKETAEEIVGRGNTDAAAEPSE